MSVFVIATSTTGKHRIPLCNVIAFQADEKYVLVHTMAHKTLFLTELMETERNAQGVCPHCGASVAATGQLSHSTQGRPLTSLAAIEQFMQGRDLPLLRIHRNCIINTNAATGKNQIGKQCYVTTEIGDFAISRRHKAATNRLLFKKRKEYATEAVTA